MHRRELLKNGAAALTVAATKPLFAWQGANNRVRMAVIGMGNRSGRVFDSLTRNDDVQFTMGCEVAQNKQTSFQNANRPLAQSLNVVGDYRRVLDRNDIDAVLIGTPDFSHAKITADALAAGKHVYVEKPIANNIARINMMLDAYNKYPNLVVQVGTQQRSWDHFIEAKKQMEKIGNVTHVLIQQPGAYAQNKADVAPVPAGLDWDAWQADAPKKPFKPGYTSFRAWWEYGSGLVGDWGAHHIDVANWFMNADAKQPLKTTAVGFYSNPNTDPECVLQPVLDRLAVRQLHHVVRQQTSFRGRTSPIRRRRTSKAGASTSTAATARCRSIAWVTRFGHPSPRRAIASRLSRHPARPRARHPAVDAQAERPAADAGARRRPRRWRAGRRDERLHQPARRRRRGLSASRAHP